MLAVSIGNIGHIELLEGPMVDNRRQSLVHGGPGETSLLHSHSCNGARIQEAARGLEHMPSEVTVFAGTTVLPRVLLAGVAPWPHAKLHQITHASYHSLPCNDRAYRDGLADCFSVGPSPPKTSSPGLEAWNGLSSKYVITC